MADEAPDPVEILDSLWSVAVACDFNCRSDMGDLILHGLKQLDPDAKRQWLRGKRAGMWRLLHDAGSRTVAYDRARVERNVSGPLEAAGLIRPHPTGWRDVATNRKVGTILVELARVPWPQDAQVLIRSYRGLSGQSIPEVRRAVREALADLRGSGVTPEG
jgi:hypothetical protein